MISVRNKFIIIPVLFTVVFGCIKAVRNEPVVYKDLHITNDTIWEGNIFVEGIVTVEAGAVLTIKPGTAVNFIWQDVNDDGVGESGLYVFGALNAKAEKNDPIVFSSGRSQDKNLWEGIYFIASEGNPNILSYCKFSNAHRALHSHFSKVVLENLTFSDNSRGFQFQESEVGVKDCTFKNNYSALRFRDSKAEIINNVFINNYSAVHAMRSDILFKNDIIKNNRLEGLRLKECKGNISDSEIMNNRQGVLFQEGEVSLDHNLISENAMDGIASNNSKLALGKNTISKNGGDGISLNQTEAILHNNNIESNKKFNLDNNGTLQISAEDNYWGNLDENETGKTIEDGRDDNVSGFVIFKPFLGEKHE